MLEMYLIEPGFTYSSCEPFTKKKNKIAKQVIQYILMKTSYIKLAFSTIWLMEILKIYLEKRRLIKFYVIKDLTLLKIQNMIDI